MSDVVISMCDLTGHFVEPWVNYGYKAVLIDPQHPEGVSTSGRVTRIGHVIDHPVTWRYLEKVLHKSAFVAGFPPCTDVAVSGARWFETKRKVDPHFQTKAALIAEQCRVIAKLSDAPWIMENPVSVFASIFGKPDHVFHPHHYTGYCKEDNYTKATCLWSGGGFVLPEIHKADGLPPPDDRIHKAPPSDDRANFRSATPRGFARAVFHRHGEL